MKIQLLAISFLFLGTLKAQSIINIPSSKFVNFEIFIEKNLVVPQSVKYDCSWNYAIVKVQTDKQGEIVNWKCINDCPDSLKRSFRFLSGYKFDKSLKIDKRTIIFYVLIENSEVCTTPPNRTYTPNEVIKQIFYCFKRETEIDNNAIIIYEPIVFTFSKVQY